MPAVDVTTFHYDLAGTGLNGNETQLTPAVVQVGSFGKEFATSVDGQVYAQPLVKTKVSIVNGPNTTAGEAGIHDVVFVATENDSLYAVDTDPAAKGVILWHRSFLDLGPNDSLPGATSVASLSSADVGTSDISPAIGITGTPVIDASNNLLYVVAKTKEMVNGAAHYVQRLHALNLSDGTDATTPYLIGDTTASNTNTTSIYVYGSGDGSVSDPYNGTGKSVVQFNALTQNQRLALALVNNTLYVAWASHGDNGPYHGWVASWNVANPTTQGFQLNGVFNTTPNGGLAGIWQGGGRLSFESDGSAFYLDTGNGDSNDSTNLNALGYPANGDYNESLLKVVADTATSPTNQNINGWGMKVADYFTPYNRVALDNADQDFGSGAPLLLPDSAGIPGHPHLLVAAGKEGKIYLIDRDNMGKFDSKNDHVLNAVPDGSGHNSPAKLIDGSLSTPAYFNGVLYWVAGYSDVAKTFVINPDGTLSATSQTTASFGYLPGSPIVSANGTMAGIVWVMDTNANAIHAYDANSFATELWNSNQKGDGSDTLGAVVKFATPVVANGEVFVGTSNSLVVYGLTPPANATPSAPVLSASSLSATSIRLSWTDPTIAPNTASGYLIEQSSDGGATFAQVATAPAGSVSLDIGGLTTQVSYSFRVRGFNAQGDSNYSNIASATPVSGGAQAPLAPTGLGAAPASATSIHLTWTNNATNQDGFDLDRATDSGFTRSLITEVLPAGPNAFTDLAAGLAPGGTYYYQLRAFNAAGSSASSSPVAVTIPLAPAKPTDAQVTGVTAGQIDLSWTDNAGRTADGYAILRAANHGTFATVASLPARNAPPPSAYTWSDTGLTAGTFYEYHIEAYNVSGHNDFAGTNATTLAGPPPSIPSPPTPTSPLGPVAYTLGFDWLFNLRVQPVEAGAPIGPALVVPFPFDFFFQVGQVTLEDGGDVRVRLDNFLFGSFSLLYDSAGHLTGFSL